MKCVWEEDKTQTNPGNREQEIIIACNGVLAVFQQYLDDPAELREDEDCARC